MKKLSLGLLSLVAAISLVGCGNSGEEKTTLKVGATAVPHAEILRSQLHSGCLNCWWVHPAV